MCNDLSDELYGILEGSFNNKFQLALDLLFMERVVQEKNIFLDLDNNGNVSMAVYDKKE